MQSDFFAYLYRLRYIERWSLMRNVVKESVAEHAYHVSIITHMLCTIANEVYQKKIDIGEAVSMALFHDATEVFTGDIPTPVKHQNPDILQSFRVIEEVAAEKLSTSVPPSLQNTYRPLLFSKTTPSELKKFVKAADLLDAYLKCISELSAGNREFAVAKKQIEHVIHEMNMPEVAYFLEHFAPSVEKTLDELSESE
jgi:5'-deoxynucleotidase